MRPLQRHDAARLVLLAGMVTTVGCAGGTGHDHGGGGYSGPPVYGELEPNDSPWEPDYLGGMNLFSHMIVEGHVEAVGWDLVDHFEIQADEPIGIEFCLHADHPYADIDLCLFDPDSGLIVGCWDSPWSPEEGLFSLDWPGKRVVLVVEAWGVDTSYSLELKAVPNPYTSEGGPPAASADLTSGSGISFPDGKPDPNPAKRGPEALDEETLVHAARNPAAGERF